MYGLTSQGLEVRFNGHIVTDFSHEVGGEIPDLVVSDSRVPTFWTGKGVLYCEVGPAGTS